MNWHRIIAVVGAALCAGAVAAPAVPISWAIVIVVGNIMLGLARPSQVSDTLGAVSKSIPGKPTPPEDTP